MHVVMTLYEVGRRGHFARTPNLCSDTKYPNAMAPYFVTKGGSFETMVYGKGDLGRSICVDVMGGWDTDSTGATVGSVVGAMCGARNLPEEWIRPLEDRLDSFILGFQHSSVSELAHRTMHLMPQEVRIA